MLMLAQFAREIELHRLHEKIAKLEGGPDVDHSEFIEDSVRIHDEITKQVRRCFAVSVGLRSAGAIVCPS